MKTDQREKRAAESRIVNSQPGVVELDDLPDDEHRAENQCEQQIGF